VRNQEPHSPRGPKSKHCHERDSNQVIGRGTFAPALEHGDHSNREQQNGADCENLEEHLSPSLPLSFRAKRGIPIAAVLPGIGMLRFAQHDNL
jgi:hypothetical protein